MEEQAVFDQACRRASIKEEFKCQLRKVVLTYIGLRLSQRYRGSDSIGLLCLSPGGSTRINDMIWVRRENQKTFSELLNSFISNRYNRLSQKMRLPGHFKGFREPVCSLINHYGQIRRALQRLLLRLSNKNRKRSETWMKTKMADRPAVQLRMH